MQYKPPEELAVSDIAALLGAVPEGKRLEYKGELPGRGDDDKAEFLKDVSALANTDGGDILYGVTQDKGTGTASGFVPIEGAMLDSEILRLHQVLDTGVRPRIAGVHMHPVEVESGKSILVVRVPQSRIGPHQLTFRQSYRFYGRNTNGTYIIEVDELRDKILRQASLAERMRDFRRERIDLIRNRPEDMPLPIEYERKLVMHFLPEETFGRYDAVDVSQIIVDPRKMQGVIAYSPVPSQAGMSYRSNIDGALFFKGNIGGMLGYYVQVFNDGSVEFVDGVAFWNSTDEPIIYPYAVETDMFAGFAFAVRVFKALGIRGRFYAFATALGVRNFTIRTPRPMPLLPIGGDDTIGRDPALFNDVVVEDQDVDAQTALYPIIAQFWRACAFNRPQSYDEQGRYIGEEFYRF